MINDRIIKQEWSYLKKKEETKEERYKTFFQYGGHFFLLLYQHSIEMICMPSKLILQKFYPIPSK